MSYRYDKEKKIRQRWYLTGSILLLLFLFTPFYHWLFSFMEKPLARSWESRNEFFDGTENFFQAFYAKEQIIKKNKELEGEVKRLTINNLRTNYLTSQLEEVYQLKNNDESLEIAQVIQQGSFGNRDTFIINKGTNQGITIGNKVITHDYVSIGYIQQVYDNTSQVVLYSQSNQTILGILFPHEVQLEAKGDGNGSFQMEIPREVEVAEGDILYSLSSPGTIIAIVRKVVFDPRDPFKQVYLSYPVNINQIQTVGVKTPKTRE